MRKRLQAEARRHSKPSSDSGMNGFLQRKTGYEHRTVPPTPRASGHDFSRVSVYSARDGVFINGPDEGSKTNPPKPPTTKPVKKGKCPTDIQVIQIKQLQDSQFGKNGMLTGIGAVALMKVSDADGNDWDGTKVTETVKQTKNTCGATVKKKACSNESGENVAFVVGAETKVVGTKVPALRNTFYDLHMYTDNVSILHQSGKDTCEFQCQQTYQCGGKQFGPEFVITYSAKKDQVANFYDVTRIRVDKAAKAAAP